jgi:hypothetical protein
VLGVDVGSEGVAARTSTTHALDTRKRQARCVVLPMLSGRQDLSEVRITIAADRAALTVGPAGQKLAFIDARDFRVSVPAKPTNPTMTGPAQTFSHNNSDRTWLLLGAGAVAIVLAASTLSVALRRRRTRLASTAQATLWR